MMKSTSELLKQVVERFPGERNPCAESRISPNLPCRSVGTGELSLPKPVEMPEKTPDQTETEQNTF